MDKHSDAGLRSAIHWLLTAGVWTSGALLAVGLALNETRMLRSGVFVLMCTPLARVAALAVGYAQRRDWRFFWISTGVLALLGVGIALGVRAH